MSNTALIVTIWSIYGPLSAIMLGMLLHHRATHKLRNEHRAEMEALRGRMDAEQAVLQGRPRLIASSPTTPYGEAYNKVALTKTLKMLQQEQEMILKRLDQLERKNKSSAA